VYELTTEDRRRLDDIIDLCRKADPRAAFEPLDVDAKLKGDYVVLNYRQGFPSNSLNVLTRGMVVEPARGRIVSMPFKRFGNLGEIIADEATEVDVADCDVLEKLDGSMVAVTFPERDATRPLIQTRRMLSTTDMEVVSTAFSGGEEFGLLRNALGYVICLDFRKCDLAYTWVFELIDRPRPVITSYKPEQMGLYLIGRRCMKTFVEASEDVLDKYAYLIGCKRPRRWPVVGDLRAVEEMMADFSDDYEGFVLRERKTGKRAKVKKKEYLERHRLLGRTLYKNLIPVYLQGETEEVVAYFPETKEKFRQIDLRFGQTAALLLVEVESLLLGHDTKKDLALSMQSAGVPRLLQSLAFASFGNKDVTIVLHERISSWPVDTLLELLALED
jgi:hypothetical protein